MSKAPIVFNLDDDTPAPKGKAKPSAVTAPPVPDLVEDTVPITSVQLATESLARPRSVWTKVVLWALTTFITLAISLAAWDFVTGLLARNIWLGRIGLGLLIIVGLGLLGLIVKELIALSRLRKIDSLRMLAEGALVDEDIVLARKFTGSLESLYGHRDALRWPMERFREGAPDIFDASGLIGFAETTLVEPLDAQALKEVEQASRRVALATALIPLTLADVIVALSQNVRMIRRIALVYGGRAGTLGSWRLLKSVAAHLVATGAIAVGDDLIGSVAGGGVVAKLSRRFGEGFLNGALTARVGIAALEVCRPMPFTTTPRPKVTQVAKRALTGVFSSN